MYFVSPGKCYYILRRWVKTAHQMKKIFSFCESDRHADSFYLSHGFCIFMPPSLILFRFFMELNNRIFQTLSEVAGSIDPTLTADHVRAMGLDPQGDRSFLVDLLEVYGFDITLVIDNPCCPWVSALLIWGTQNCIFTGYLCLLAPDPLHIYERTHWALETLPLPWDIPLFPSIL